MLGADPTAPLDSLLSHRSHDFGLENCPCALRQTSRTEKESWDRFLLDADSQSLRQHRICDLLSQCALLLAARYCPSMTNIDAPLPSRLTTGVLAHPRIAFVPKTSNQRVGAIMRQ